MPFTPETRAKVRRYLGYPVLDGAELLDGGQLPAGITGASFILEEALDRVQPAAEFMVVEALARIECIEANQMQAYSAQIVQSAGRVTFAGPQAITSSLMAYNLETDKLADLLHVPKFAPSLLHHRISGSGEGSVDEPG